MKTANFPRAVIERCQVPFAVTQNDWLISITHVGGDDLRTSLPFGKVLYLRFNDTQREGEGEISPNQARAIAELIQQARSEQRNLYVNCHAGVCRSGAIVALLLDLGWNEHHNSASPRRIPNTLVYECVRKHFPEFRQSWDLSWD